MGGDNLHLAAVHRVVVFVGVWRDLTIQQERPSPRRRIVKIFLLVFIQERCSWHFLIYGEFRVGHEVVDGVLVLGFLNTFMEGTMECFDHFDLYRGGRKKGMRKHKGENWLGQQRTGGLRRETKPQLQNTTAQQPKPNT